MSITDWDVHDRPREKLDAGRERIDRCRTVGDFLRMGVQGKSAVDLAQELIRHLRLTLSIIQRNSAELTEIKGIWAVPNLRNCKRCLR